MKKNKNEINELSGSQFNPKSDLGITGKKENLPRINFPYFPPDEDFYLNKEESDLKNYLNQYNSFSHIEIKQSENYPITENTGFSFMPFLVNVKSYKFHPLPRKKLSENESKVSKKNHYYNEKGDYCQDTARKQNDNI